MIRVLEDEMMKLPIMSSLSLLGGARLLRGRPLVHCACMKPSLVDARFF